MSGILNEDDLSALAAEYVIGTLDPDERERANALLDVDEGFRALVRAWERRLGELHLMVEPVEPDEKIWERIKAKLPAPPEPEPESEPAEAPAAEAAPAATAPVTARPEAPPTSPAPPQPTPPRNTEAATR